MESAPFPIIPLAKAVILSDEPMGSKEKFWCHIPEMAGESRWLFKSPRKEPGKIEHVAEKLAWEIGGLIGIPCARVEFAEFEGVRGTIAKDVRESGEALVHGNEVLAGRVLGYDRQKARRTSAHTYKRIQQAILEACGASGENEFARFAGFLVFDALIGNTDRHHENWALLRKESGEKTEYRLSPSFDHASSLGREMLDARRERILREAKVRQYLEAGAGAIFLSEEDPVALSPGRLVAQLARAEPARFGFWLDRLALVTSESLDDILDRIPTDWITVPQRAFAKSLVLEAKVCLMELAE
jgi:hypothetical protein